MATASCHAGTCCDERAGAVDDERRAVEDELVLAADAVDVDDRQAGLAHPFADHVAAQRLLPRVVRRAVGDDDDLRPGGAGLARGARKPDVLADHDAHAQPCDVDDARLAAGLEIALLVEHGVVGQLALAIDRRDPPVAQHRERVVALAGGVLGEADQHDRVRNLRGKAREFAAHASRKAGRSSRSSGG